MPRLSPRRNSAIAMARSATSRKAASRRNGRTTPPSCARRTATRAGRSNTPRPSQANRARLASIWLSRPSATRTTSASIERHGLIRRWVVTDAARYDGALLPQLIDRNNTAGDVWADTAYRSRKNEKFLASRLLRSQIHRKKPKGAPMPRHTAHANARKSAIRSAVEHVFARQKGPMGLFVRTIGIARARTKIGLAKIGRATCRERV